MVDFITPTAPGPFDTAALQLAQAHAQAAATNSNQEAYLREIAKINEEANACALTGAAEERPEDNFFNNSLLNLDPALAPTDEPSILSIFNEVDADAAVDESIKARQLEILQKDAALLEEAANENNHIPLSSNASTVDLSPEVLGLVDALSADAANDPTALTPAQLARISETLQPVANEPLTPALLQQIQAQLPMPLNLYLISFAMNITAGTQANPYHMIENRLTPNNAVARVTPIAAIGDIALDGSMIR